jgi:beta-galactosidase
MYGMRAVNFYMLVERERWQGSPITRHGDYRACYADFYRKLSAFLQQYPLGRCNRQTQVVALLNYDLGRYAAMASTLHYAHVDLLGLPDELGVVDLDLGFRWDVAREADHHRTDIWLGQVFLQLKQRQIDYDIADSHIDLLRLQRYPIACLPTVDFMDAADQQRLLDYVAAGGCLIMGPGVPYLDSNLRPCSVLSAVAQEAGEVEYGGGRIICATTDSLAALAQCLPSPAIRWDEPDVDVVEQVGETRRLLFIANPRERSQHVTLTFDTPLLLTPVWGRATSDASRGAQLTLEIAPYSIQVWEIQHD